MDELNEKEINDYIEKRRTKELRVIKYISVLIITVGASYALHYLGANIWHIIIAVMAIELVFIIADLKPKIDEEKDEKYRAEFIKKKEYQRRRQERIKARKQKSQV